MKFLLILALTLSACSQRDPKPPSLDERVSELRDLQSIRLGIAEDLRDENGWLAGTDCDGMVWAGKYAAAAGVDGVALERAEYADQPGRFGRRVEPCWTLDAGDVGSKSTWSRDQANLGLFPAAWRTKNLDLLNRHAAHGEASTWVMGEPSSEDSVYYTPQLIGLLFQTIFALGGTDNTLRHTPQIYLPGLDDYEAHNQMMSIWLRSELAESLKEADAVPRPLPTQLILLLDGQEFIRREGKDGRFSLTTLSVSEQMYRRIIEHSEREPDNPFYWALRGIYGGDMTRAIDLCLREDMPVGSYVRCADFKQCQLAEAIFACDLVLRRY